MLKHLWFSCLILYKVVAVGLEIDGYLHIVECPNVKLSEDVIVLMMRCIQSSFVVLDSNLYDLNWWNSGHLKHVCFTSSPYYYTKSHDVITINQWKQLDDKERPKWSKLYNCGLYVYRVTE